MRGNVRVLCTLHSIVALGEGTRDVRGARGQYQGRKGLFGGKEASCERGWVPPGFGDGQVTVGEPLSTEFGRAQESRSRVGHRDGTGL